MSERERPWSDAFWDDHEPDISASQRPPVVLTRDEMDLLAGVWDEETTVSVSAFFPMVARMIAARLAPARAMHHQRPWMPGDFVAHGQTEFPDLCAACRTRWPCPTAQALGDG